MVNNKGNFIMQPKNMNLIIKYGNSNDQTDLFQIASSECIDMGQYATDINLNKNHEFFFSFSNIVS